MTTKTILVVGATGATGRRLVGQLLAGGHSVRVIVRSASRLPAELVGHDRLRVTEGDLLHMDEAELREAVSDCDAVASCLGHNLSLRGLFGPPWRLVTGAVSRLCAVIEAGRPERPVRFVLMCSAAVRNHDLGERVSLPHRVVLFLLRLLVPPHADNEQAANYLRTRIARQNPSIEWAVVRPDGLQEGDEVTDYVIHESPTRSAIFDAGQARRVNVAHWMARLATEEAAWQEWRYRMPVLYNREGVA